jgi:hypothetical protein
VVGLLAWYIRTHRPVLLKDCPTALFPGSTGGSKSPALLGT